MNIFKKFLNWLNGPEVSEVSSLVIPTKVPYVPKYATRTEFEHASIRSFITPKIGECSHLKGRTRHLSGFHPKGVSWDYNLSLFTFIDGTPRIRCNSCGQKWFKKDKDWAKMLNLFNNMSSNSSCSSEVPSGRTKSKTAKR